MTLVQFIKSALAQVCIADTWQLTFLQKSKHYYLFYLSCIFNTNLFDPD